MCVGIQLRAARPIRECSANVGLALASVVSSFSDSGSHAWCNAVVFGELWCALFCVEKSGARLMCFHQI